MSLREMQDLYEMQDLLNALDAYFKVFVYPQDGQIMLRVFYNHLLENPEYKDITYSFDGHKIGSGDER